ncbi:peptidylprolyl isomerase SurA [Alishewanella sp. 16-MA]|uniref:Chaperone SurA n=1 Tax=Alishewanella maricola TaxID=2795740 RepID=A0ABS8C7R3_9ALTE|nr:MULTISPECIES: peptidylprolyl isomerase SurA [Alishewanella]MDP4944987.1 peptidylprolyl isomerase SurA [Alishewanella sp.]MDP5207398.1 peptidylprolyl isomerase SurA [Alishewanella sp. SMS9]MCB5228341.1 peptidylprolyl isomerase SurA [Alishewanella maricola]MDP5035974.1 peptidylprolyl isomerase SurA [Alishewanella sp.]MDP5186201.1 peptidylprolyl isomerase SurA [Alishewanella sp.]
MKLQQIICVVLLGFASVSLTAAEREIDRVAAIVDSGVILKSDVDEIVQRVKRNAEAQGQTLPSDLALRTQATERLIMTNLQLQMAQRMGLQISDAQLDDTIRNIAQGENLSMEQFRQQVINEEGNYERFREKVREEIMTNEVLRGNVQRRIYISQQEVDNLVKLMEEQGAISEQYQLGHILIAIPSQATTEQITESRERAEQVLKLLRDGSDFRRIAIASSSGANALEGGQLDWMNINEMPTLFSEGIRGRKKGDLIGPLRSGAGFHILTIFDIRGENVAELTEVNSRHILIKPSIIVSEERARTMLLDMATKLRAGDADFAELAKQFSEDPGSKLNGGNLGWSETDVYVPAFRDTLNRLQPDELSEPFRTEHGWHIVQLLERRTVDATADKKRNQVYRMIFNRRFNEESASFLRELRDDAYIEVLAED